MCGIIMFLKLCDVNKMHVLTDLNTYIRVHFRLPEETISTLQTIDSQFL